MTWKKTWFSYLLWGVYLLLTGIFTVAFLQKRGVQLGITGVYALLWALVPFLAGAILFALVRFCIGRTQKRIFPKALWIILEVMFFLAVLAVGIWLRIEHFPVQMEENGYYSMACVTGEVFQPGLVHPVEKFYIILLHQVFLFFGNRWQAGILLQTILQLGASVFLYSALRRLAGGLAALWAWGFLLLSPMFYEQGFVYGPEMLFLFLYSLVFSLLASGLKSYGRKESGGALGCIGSLFLGIVLGALIYLDVLGSTLLFLAAGFFQVVSVGEKDSKQTGWGGLYALFLLIGAFLGLLGMFIWSAVQGEGILNAANTWEWLFMPREWEVAQLFTYIQPGNESDLISCLILVAGLGVSVFSMGVHKKQDMQRIFYLALFASLLFTYRCRAQESMDRSFLFSLWLVLAEGSGLQELFRRPPEPAKTPVKESVKPISQEKVVPKEEISQPVKRIENPLPLPKKHVKKTMGYGVNVSEDQLYYDLEVSPEDDFPLE